MKIFTTLLFLKSALYTLQKQIKMDYLTELKNINYKIVALTGFDYMYNKGEKIAFSNDVINATQDSFISLLAFNPIFEIDSTISNITQIKSDSIISYDLDSIQKGKLQTGSLKINTKNACCILQHTKSKSDN